MDEIMVRQVIAEVLAKQQKPISSPIPVEVSARHVHLSHAHVAQLFGAGYKLQNERELSQPGQYLCKERVRLVGPKGVIEHVAVLGPERAETQVEISLTDARQLGVSAPVQLSGNLNGAADILIFAGKQFVNAPQSVIVAQNHVHMSPADAEAYGVSDQDLVAVRVCASRTVTFENVAVRVNRAFCLAMHIDYDEGNACGWQNGIQGAIVRKCSGLGAPAGQGAAEKESPVLTSVSPERSALDWEGKVITASSAQHLRALGKKKLYFSKGTLITPSAKDVFHDAGITVEIIAKAGE